jgi:nucleoside-diphosphate-sugar epimerase
MASCYPNTLGLRIFPVYGPGEERTVISQWCKAMKKGEQPVIYGNGQQRRDFIYIDDAVNQIISLSENTSGIVDVGAGNPVKFRKIVEIINSVLKTDIKPIFAKEPEGYSVGITCHSPLSTQINLENGIRKLLGREV